jgi:hypothetical protein
VATAQRKQPRHRQGADEFANLELCRQAIDVLRRGLTELDVALRRVGHEWTWLLLHSHIPVVVAGHNYDRKIRCERALQQFVERAAAAPINATIMVSTTRRWTASPASRRLESSRMTADRARWSPRRSEWPSVRPGSSPVHLRSVNRTACSRPMLSEPRS